MKNVMKVVVFVLLIGICVNMVFVAVIDEVNVFRIVAALPEIAKGEIIRSYINAAIHTAIAFGCIGIDYLLVKRFKW